MYWFELKGLLEDLGYKHPKKLWYTTPKIDINMGLTKIKANNDVMKMIKFGLPNGYVEAKKRALRNMGWMILMERKMLIIILVCMTVNLTLIIYLIIF